MAQPNPGGQPPTFRSNVNRAKTKKWIEAKSYSYDGDDWGDVDDYDEYGGYDEPPPPLQPPRATGLRQRGQSASQPTEQYKGPPVQQSPYGDLGPSQSQQPYGNRSFTQPSQPPSVHRQNSFDPEEERRAFYGGPPQPSGQRSATGPYPTSIPQNQPIVHDFQSNPNLPGQNHQGLPPSNLQPRQNIDDEARYPAQSANPQGLQKRFPSPQLPGPPNMDNRSQSMASNNSSLEFHNRRDFSPSAMPPPLQTKGSPSPNRGGSRPPRTSSLGQDSAPQLPFPAQPPTTVPSVESTNVPRPQRDRASSSQSAKSIPFVRPADIYRRMEEEKERERRSQETSRPSMEAVLPRPKLDDKRDSASGGRPRQISSLDPVQERRQSEFALEGQSSNMKAGAEPEAQSQPAEKIPTTSKRFDIKKSTNNQPQTGVPSLGPMLPDVARMSGFGDSFGESFMGSPGGLGEFSSQVNPEATSTQVFGENDLQSRSTASTKAQDNRGTDLQHQPSLGFTSAVHQSFDNAQDQVPPTPSSNADSSIQRSTSGGTSTVSPIISRGPSTATEPWNNNLPTIDDVASPTHRHDVQSSSQRPISLARKPSPSLPTTEQSLPSPPPSFIPGHRRNMSTPSPDNSPARTPVVEANRRPRPPQEVELAEATPTPTESDYSADENLKATRGSIDQYPTPDQLALSEGRGRTAPDQTRVSEEFAMAASPTIPTGGSAHERPDSAGSSKVRNLADKFGGSGSRPQSSRSNATPRASMLGPGVSENEDLVRPPLLNERMESFRPHLPGGWESSASIAPAADFGGQATPAQSGHAAGIGSAGSQPTPREIQRPASRSADDAPSALTQIKDASQDAFAAAATAGTALAASLAAATGVGRNEGEGQESEEEWEKNSDDATEQSRDRGTSFNTITRSDISMPPLDPRVDKAASAAPTPLPKDTPTQVEGESAGSGYFTDLSLAKPPPVGERSEDGSRRNSHQLPPLSTDLQPPRHQYESDRLRREIVKELTPNTVSEPSTAESNSPYPTSSKYSMDQSAGPKSTPESGGLPQQHGNYWNHENGEEDRMQAINGKPSEVQHLNTAQPIRDAAASGTASAIGGVAFAGVPTSHSPPQKEVPMKAVETSQQSHEKPHMHPHRFSWEAPLTELGPQQGPELASGSSQPPNPAPVHQPLASNFLKSAVYPEGHSLEGRDAASRDTPKRLSDQSSTVAETSTLGLNNSLRSREGNREAAVDSHNTDVAIDEADSRAIEEANRDKELPSYPNEGPEVVQYTPEKQVLEASSSGPGPGTDDQSYSGPVLQDQSDFSTTGKSTLLSTIPTDAPLPPASTGPQPNIPSFRALLALKTPTERIRAYDNTREQFANINTGLTNWLAVTTQDLPEHSDLLTNQGRAPTSFQGHRSSPSRPGVPSGSSTGAPTYAPGFSPSSGGGKISGKEVQAKSKELLHTAGVFGGKGIVAGKGLFSKGKSKLRGASGTDKAPPVAIPAASPGPVFQGMQRPEQSRIRTPEQSALQINSVSHVQTAEPRHPESLQSGSNTPSEQSVSKGRLGDDERSSDDYESAQSGPDEAGPPPPRSSSLFIGDKIGSNTRSQPVPKSTTSSGDTTRTVTHQTANTRSRKGTQSPRSTHSSNKTPTQSSFDHAKAMPSMPYTLERTESPQEANSALNLQPMSNPSSDMQPSATDLPNSLDLNQNLQDDAPRNVEESDHAQRLEEEDTSIYQSLNNPTESESESIQKRPGIRTSQLILPTPEFSPLMGEGYTGLSISPSFAREGHGRGLSIGSVPSMLDPERPPSPVSPFVPPSEDPIQQQRGRPVVPVHHGIDHDFIEESSVERARRRSPSFSRPFQTGRTSEDSRPFIDRGPQDHPAFRPSSDSSETEALVEFRAGRSSGRGLREQAPEYQGSGQGAPDMPPVETKPRSRRGSRSSAYFKAIRDSVSPSRKSHARERSQPPLPDGSRASDSPHSAIRASNQTDAEEKPRRSSIFGRIKTNNSSRSDQVPSKETSVPRAATMPVQQPFQTNVGTDRPPENDSPVSSKMSTANRLTQKLQRASTTVNQPKPEHEGAKKKRFSGIGSLFGRNPRRQNSGQFTPAPPQQYQQHVQPTKRSRGPQRFPLDDDPEQGPPLAPRQHTAHGMDGPPLQAEPSRQPQAQPQRDLPAYVQDRMLRQPSLPSDSSRVQMTTSQPSPGNFNSTPRHSHLPSPQPTSAQSQGTHVGSRPPPAARSTGSWTRFSQSGRSNSNSQHSQSTAAPPQPLASPSHANDFVSSPPLGYESRPTQRSWIEGTTPPPRTFSTPPQNPPPENQRPIRSESPPPPPPPPKDSRWSKTPSTSKSPSNHARSGSTPLQPRRSPAAEQRQSLPPLQTNVSRPRVSARSTAAAAAAAASTPTPKQPHLPSTSMSEKESMTPEEKRRSRQEEIERAHLSPSNASSATMSAGYRGGQGKISVLQEDPAVNEKEATTTVAAGSGGNERGVEREREEEEPIVMSATSFPGQMWQPDYLGWEGE